MNPTHPPPLEPTKLRFEEIFGKIALEELFPGRFPNLVLTDRPDLMDIEQSVGIEITSIMPERKQKILTSWRSIAYAATEARSRYIHWLGQLGFEYQEDAPVPIKKNVDFGRLPNRSLEAYRSKTEKLQGYQDAQFYELLILSDFHLTDSAFKFLRRLNYKLHHEEEHFRTYRRVYLVGFDGVCEFDLESGGWELYSAVGMYLEWSEVAEAEYRKSLI